MAKYIYFTLGLCAGIYMYNSAAFLLGVVSGVYVAQNYNVPQVKTLIHHAYRVFEMWEVTNRKHTVCYDAECNTVVNKSDENLIDDCKTK